MAQLAETSLEHTAFERRRIDEFGRDVDQREWTDKHVYVEERDEDGDIIPDGEFSISDANDTADFRDLEVASDCKDSVVEDLDSVREFGRFGSCQRPRGFARGCRRLRGSGCSTDG